MYNTTLRLAVLLAALIRLCEGANLSSLHLLFAHSADVAAAEAAHHRA